MMMKAISARKRNGSRKIQILEWLFLEKARKTIYFQKGLALLIYQSLPVPLGLSPRILDGA
jgi:hypothetical protein